MTIIISTSDLLDYHKNKYEAGNEHIRNYINTKGKALFEKQISSSAIFPSVKHVNRTEVCEINDLVFDADTLEERITSNRTSYINDVNVQNYLESQKHHKIRFLEEIKAKGIQLKHDVRNAEGQQSNTRPMNY